MNSIPGSPAWEPAESARRTSAGRRVSAARGVARQGLAGAGWGLSVSDLRAADFGHGRYAVSSLELGFKTVAPSDVVAHRPPTRNQRNGLATGAACGQCPDGVDLATQSRGSRRDLRWGCGSGRAGSASRDQGAGRDRGRSSLCNSGMGRTRMRMVADASTASLLGFERKAVELGTTVHTSGLATRR